jgi:hypothetical protein
MTPGYFSPIDACRRCGLSIEEVLVHAITVGGEPMIPASLVERIAEERNALARAEQEKWQRGELEGSDRRY